MLLRMLILLLFLPVAALCQDAAPSAMPVAISDTVNDFADVLPPEAEARVSEALRVARAETGVHVVLVTLQSLGTQEAGLGIQGYAKRLFNTWGIGDAGLNDGILILVVPGDREMRIALGSSYDSVWDNAAQRAIDRSFLPAFREDRFAEGIEAGVAATVELIARPFAAGQDKPAAPEKGMGELVPALLFGLFALLIIGGALRERIAGAATRMKPCPNCHGRVLHREREIVEAATTGATGRGMIHIRCRNCGWHRDTPFTVAARRTGDKSDFGGGGSSGGGASGKW